MSGARGRASGAGGAIVLAAVLAAGLASGLGGCAGKTGTYAITLVTAPGSHVLDGAARGRVALSDPHTVVEAARNADGSFALDLDVAAAGGSATVSFEALDAGGAVIAWGRTPPLPVAAIDATLRIYVAAPGSMAAAPVALTTPRTDVAVAPLVYGALLAGGSDASGAPRADLVIYDAYDHQLQSGLDLPSPRTRLTAVAGATGYAYLFGGAGAGGAATSTFWRFDTSVAPAGAYQDLTAMAPPDLARAGAAGAAIGGEEFLVTGAPPMLIDGVGLRAAPLTMPASLGGLPVTLAVGASDVAVFVGAGAGAGGVTLYDTLDGFHDVAGAPADALRTGHGVTATSTGKVYALGGAVGGAPVASMIAVDVAATPATAISIPAALATPRTGAAVAASGPYAIAAGGTDAGGAVLGDVEVIDTSATPMTRVSIPLVTPRTGATAVALPDGHVLVIGGVDAAGAPVGTLELYTPPAPAAL